MCKKLEYLERTTDQGEENGKLSHLQLRVECRLFVIYKDRERTIAVLVIGSFELLGIPTFSLIEPPILIGINCVLYEVCVYAGYACITVDLHESDKRNDLLGTLLIDN